jgi:hypothetical protein
MKKFNSIKWITENKYGKTLLKEAIDPKSNLKDTPAQTIVDGMLSGDENNEVIAMIKAFSSDALPAEATKQWAEKIGREKLISRISAVQEKIPSVAPSKAEMPALEPENAQAVKDALDDDDGGKYAIDIAEPFAPTIKKEDVKPDFNDPRFPTNLDKSSGKDWLQRGKKDGAEGDDDVVVLTGQSMKVGEMSPTQSNILIGKSLFFATVVVPTGNLDKLDGFATDEANGSAILDGHHRWSGQYIANGPTKDLTGVITVASPAETAIPMLRSVGNALGNQQKEGLKELETDNTATGETTPEPSSDAETQGDVEILLRNIDKINTQAEMTQVLQKIMNHIAAGKVTGGALSINQALGSGPASSIKKQFGIKEDSRSSLYERIEKLINKK